MVNKDYIESISGAERRFVSPELRFSTRDDIEIAGGHAALYNVRTDLGWFEEEIAPGAFDGVLLDDVRALFNHDPNYILARSIEGKGTLILSVDERGLLYDFEIPKTTAGQDLKVSLERGDISQSSFGFTIEEEEWITRDGEKDLRIIKKMKRLYDVSPVTFPAYQDTTVAKRSYDALKEQENTKTKVTRKAMDEYEARFRFEKLK